MCYYDTYGAALTYCNKWVLNNKNKVKWFFMILGTIATLYKYIISRCFIIRGYKMYTLHGHSVRLEKLRTRTIWQTHNNNCLGTNLELILFKSSCYNKPRRYYYFIFLCVHLNEDVVTVKKMSVIRMSLGIPRTIFYVIILVLSSLLRCKHHVDSLFLAV